MTVSQRRLQEDVELTYDEFLRRALPLVTTKRIFGEISRDVQYYDEAKLWHFSALVDSRAIPSYHGPAFSTQGAGVSFFSAEEALVKCIAEAVERYCTFVWDLHSVLAFGSFASLRKKGAIDPASFARYSMTQLKRPLFSEFFLDASTPFSWSEAYSLLDNTPVLIPSQLLSLLYPYKKAEGRLYPHNTSGVAGGSTRTSSIIRGIYELIERDAFLIYYLNRIPGRRIRLSSIKDPRIRKISDTVRRYRLTLHCLDITTDIGIPVVVAIVIDRSGIGKAVSVGLRSDINRTHAVIGAVHEAFHTRCWLRSMHELDPHQVTPKELLAAPDHKKRGLLWYPTKQISNISFFFGKKSSVTSPSLPQDISEVRELEILRTAMRHKGYDVYICDITRESFHPLPFYVTKTVIPQLVPFYLNDNFPPLGAKRLYEVPARLGYQSKSEKELNTFPHPFM